MQWLIDLVIEAIGVPPCFIDRGDTAAADYTKDTLTTDEAWHTLDLSAIVPKGTTAVAIRLFIRTGANNRYVTFKRNGQANNINSSYVLTQASNVSYGCDIIVPVDSDRKVEYKIENVVWTTCNVTIKGWWL